MPAPKYAKRADANEKDIVNALEKIGCTVVVIGTPVDLLVGYRNRTYLLEVKNPDSAYGKKGKAGTAAQDAFLKNWRGQVEIVSSPEQAIAVVCKR